VSGPARIGKESIIYIYRRFSGTKNSISDSISTSLLAAKEHGCLTFEFAKNREEMDSLWAARKEALWSNFAVKPEGTVFWGTDVAVPLSAMAGLIGVLTLSLGNLGRSVTTN
jgi:D-lactate dehydrogenase (cytochrome)